MVALILSSPKSPTQYLYDEKARKLTSRTVLKTIAYWLLKNEEACFSAGLLLCYARLMLLRRRVLLKQSHVIRTHHLVVLVIDDVAVLDVQD